MRIATLLSCMAMLLVMNPAAAQQTVEKVRTEPTKMVCKKFEATGTRLGKRRVCATEEQWRQRTQADQDDINRLQASGTQLRELTD